MGITTSPHEWQPLRWFDRLLPDVMARCRYCIAPRVGHPRPDWFTARALEDWTYYDNDTAHEIYYDELWPDEGEPSLNNAMDDAVRERQDIIGAFDPKTR